MEETLLDVKGMSCPSCVRHIDAALTGVDGVQEVEVRLTEGSVLVRHAHGVTPGALVGALEGAGYESLPVG